MSKITTADQINNFNDGVTDFKKKLQKLKTDVDVSIEAMKAITTKDGRPVNFTKIRKNIDKEYTEIVSTPKKE